MYWVIAIAVAFVAIGVFAFDLFVKSIQRRAVSALAALNCPNCGKPFGQATAVAARTAHIASCEEMRRQRPDLLINFSRVWKVRCQCCDAAAEFHSQTMKLTSPAP